LSQRVFVDECVIAFRPHDRGHCLAPASRMSPEVRDVASRLSLISVGCYVTRVSGSITRHDFRMRDAETR
jgi:hypothetical protein